MAKEKKEAEISVILDEVIEGLRNGTMDRKNAFEIVNAIGKKVKLKREVLEYNKCIEKLKNFKKILFFEN